MNHREQLIEKAALLAAQHHYDPDLAEWEPGDRDWLLGMVGSIVDAILPQISTVEEWLALPGTTFVVGRDRSLWEKMVRTAGAHCAHGADGWQRDAAELVEEFGPLTVVWQPEVDHG